MILLFSLTGCGTKTANAGISAGQSTSPVPANSQTAMPASSDVFLTIPMKSQKQIRSIH